jgi:hypothetical protein
MVKVLLALLIVVHAKADIIDDCYDNLMHAPAFAKDNQATKRHFLLPTTEAAILVNLTAAFTSLRANIPGWKKTKVKQETYNVIIDHLQECRAGLTTFTSEPLKTKAEALSKEMGLTVVELMPRELATKPKPKSPTPQPSHPKVGR